VLGTVLEQFSGKQSSPFMETVMPQPCPFMEAVRVEIELPRGKLEAVRTRPQFSASSPTRLKKSKADLCRSGTHFGDFEKLRRQNFTAIP